MNGTLRALIFDFDGLILDTEAVSIVSLADARSTSGRSLALPRPLAPGFVRC